MPQHLIIHGDSVKALEKFNDESIHLCVTSPPYFNAKDYSEYESVEKYMSIMRGIFIGVFRVLQNHRCCVVNVADVIGKVGTTERTMTKIPLAANFIDMMIEIGFEFADDYIWDKGEVESKRISHAVIHKSPFYVYPANCYEHVLIFHKHVLDKTRLPCPVCHSMNVSSNGEMERNVYGWECNNPGCERSDGDRGKRFSARTIMMTSLDNDENRIPVDLLNRWRRDVVRLNPVIKINSHGKNMRGHSAPFPDDIPRMAISFFTGKGETVIDPFAGSFTTTSVADECGRNSVGIEIVDEYIELAKRRFELRSRQSTLLDEPSTFQYIESDECSSISLARSKWWDQDDYLMRWR
jgi:DNA modification methylase